MFTSPGSAASHSKANKWLKRLVGGEELEPPAANLIVAANEEPNEQDEAQP